MVALWSHGIRGNFTLSLFCLHALLLSRLLLSYPDILAVVDNWFASCFGLPTVSNPFRDLQCLHAKAEITTGPDIEELLVDRRVFHDSWSFGSLCDVVGGLERRFESLSKIVSSAVAQPRVPTSSTT